MQLLFDRGWRTVLPGETGSHADSSPSDHEKNRGFILVFDDGYESVYRYAFPILSKFGSRAVVFVPSGYIGRFNDWDHNLLGRRFRHLDVGMLEEMVSAGWTIGSHTVSHRSLTGLDDNTLKNELVVSRKTLEDLLKIQIHWIAFPYGRYDRRVIKAAFDTGYSGTVVPVTRRLEGLNDFLVLDADAVYLWDSVGSANKRLLRKGYSYKIGRGLRYLVNRASGGTIVWKKIFLDEKSSQLFPS